MAPEPVTSSPPRKVRRPLTVQMWRDVTFLHWRYPREAVARLLPDGLEVDMHEGTTWVGVVSLRMTRVRLAGAPPVPYLSGFLETNVRVYSVDRLGRRGVVFLAMEASRLPVVLAGRAGLRLPYHWAAMRLRRHGTDLAHSTARRWPAPRGAGLAFRVGVGEQVPGTPLQHFLADRWGLHRHGGGGLRYLPLEHPPWTFRAARLLDFREGGLIEATGLPAPPGPPVDVLYAQAMPVRIGPPAR